MALSDLILRETSFPPLTTKGAELNYSEHDANIIEIYTQLASLASGGGLTPWSAGTTYSGTVYVSHNGNIWKYVSGSPSSGVEPGTNPAVWLITSVGEFIHAQNTDQYLDQGGVNEVSAADLFDIVTNQVIDIDTATFTSLYASRNLKPNRIYAINDFQTSATLFIRSIGGDYISGTGWFSKRVPSAANPPWNKDVFNAINSYVSWDGFVYRKITGAATTVTPDSDGTNWSMQSPSGSRYELRTFECGVMFDGATLGINWLRDEKYDNLYGWSAGLYFGVGILFTDASNIRNRADSVSDITQLSRISGIVNANTFVNSSIGFESGGNIPGGGFSSNYLMGSEIVAQETINSEISGNTLLNVELSFPDGLAVGCDFQQNRIYFAGKTIIRVRGNDRPLSAIDIDNHGSNAEDTIDITGVTILDLESNGYPDMFGKIILSSSNSNENLDKVSNGARLFPIVIKPSDTLTVDVTVVGGGSVSSNDVIVGNNGAGFSLVGSKSEYMVLKPVVINGYNVYQVETLIKN